MEADRKADSANEAARNLDPPASKTVVSLIAPVTLVITTSIFYGGYYHCPSIPYPAPDGGVEAKIYYTARCTLPLVIILILAFMTVSWSRFLKEAVFNPLAGRDDLIQIHKNFLSNTVEQLLTWLLLTCILVTYLEGEEMRLIPLYSLAFVVGRILFRIGYSIHPTYRSFGFHVNLQSALFVLALIIYFMVTRGAMFGIKTGGLTGEGGRAEL